MKKKALKKEVKDFQDERSLLELSIRVLAGALKRSAREKETLKTMYVNLIDLKDGLENRIKFLESNNLELNNQIQITKTLP